MSFPVPEGIPSAITLPELRLLQRFAHEVKTVLEIGTQYGFSCIGMALAGAHVTSVDPHNEGPADAPDTWEPFLANLRRSQIAHSHHNPTAKGAEWLEGFFNPLYARIGQWPGYVDTWRESVEEFEAERVKAGGTPVRFGLVFIDGDHTWPAPWRDAEIAMAHLTARGYIAFHDVNSNWPDVYRAALRLHAKGWRTVGRTGCLRVYQYGRPASWCSICGAQPGSACDAADHEWAGRLLP